MLPPIDATHHDAFCPIPSVYFLAAIFLGAITCLDDGSDGVRTRAHTKVEEEDLIVDVGANGACIRRPRISIRRPRRSIQRGGYVMVAAGGYTKGVCYWGFIKNEGTCKARAGYRAGYRARKYIREACTRKRGV